MLSLGPSVHKHREPHSVQTVSQFREATASAFTHSFLQDHLDGNSWQEVAYLVFREAALGACFLWHGVLGMPPEGQRQSGGPGDQGLSYPIGEPAAPSSAPSPPHLRLAKALLSPLPGALWACESPQPFTKVSELPRPCLALSIPEGSLRSGQTPQHGGHGAERRVSGRRSH